MGDGRDAFADARTCAGVAACRPRESGRREAVGRRKKKRRPEAALGADDWS